MLLFEKEDAMKKFGKIMVLSLLFSLFIVTFAHAQDFSIVDPSFTGRDNSINKGEYSFEIVHEGSITKLTVKKGNKTHISLSNIEANILTNNNRMYYMTKDKNILTMYRTNLKDKKTTKVSSVKIPNLELTQMKYFVGSDLYISVFYKNNAVLIPDIYKFDFAKKKFVKLLSKADLPSFSSRKIFYVDFGSDILRSSDLNGKETKLLEKSVIYHTVLEDKLYYVMQDKENNCYVYTATAKGTNKQKISPQFQANQVWSVDGQFINYSVYDDNGDYDYVMNIKTGEKENFFTEDVSVE